MLVEAQDAQDRSFGSASKESEDEAHGSSKPFRYMLSLEPSWQRSQVSLSTPSEAESNVEGDLLSPDEVLDSELHARAQEAHGHYEGLGGKERTSSRETCGPIAGYPTTLAHTGPKFDGGQGVPGELLDGSDKEKDGATHGRDGHIERTGTPIWGGYWKDKTAWPSDLTTTLAHTGQTKEDLWAKRREWLKKCSGFWSKREREETSRILSGQVMAGPVYGIAMDKWVNDLDDETVRARYLTGNADI